MVRSTKTFARATSGARSVASFSNWGKSTIKDDDATERANSSRAIPEHKITGSGVTSPDIATREFSLKKRYLTFANRLSILLCLQPSVYRSYIRGFTVAQCQLGEYEQQTARHVTVATTRSPAGTTNAHGKNLATS
jgi:hypothetical protein